MKRKFMVSLVLVALLIVVSGVASAADSQPSAKATAAINKLYAIGGVNSNAWVTGTGWTTIHSQDIKTANDKDLFVDVSMQCGLYTKTKSELKVGGDTSTAKAQLEVRVLLDGDVEAEPGIVIFDKRVQTLTTALYTALSTSAGDPIDNIGYVELILETLQAHAFNFVFADVPSGVHSVEVQARVVTEADALSASAKAAVGMGSTTIESVRMIKDENIIVDID